MTITDEYILFYGYDWPSNFAPSPITVYDDFWEKGLFGDEPYFPPTVTFKTAEAYYQSRKAIFANDKERYYKIAAAKTPGETKRIAREINLDPRKWNIVRVGYMWETLRKKFEQNPDLMEKLLDEKLDEKKFIEASPTDAFWGAGMDEINLARYIEEREFEGSEVKIGKNMLGKLLTKLRNFKLKKEG